MMLRTAWCEVMELIGLADPWWEDVARYYGVGRRRAIALGTRRKDRRPDLPGSATCRPVSGKTWDELWAAKPRTTPAEIASFYHEVGSWCVFRQLVRHRGRSFHDVAVHLPSRGTFLEYGCGIAPISWWLAHHHRLFRAVLVDVPSEPLEFGLSRLVKFAMTQPGGSRLYVDRWTVNPMPRRLPSADCIAILEVLEHVPSPILVMRSILAALKPGGWLLEDFRAHDGDGSPTDLESAAMERPAMYHLLRRECRLVSGEVPEAPFGGGRRWWVKR